MINPFPHGEPGRYADEGDRRRYRDWVRQCEFRVLDLSRAENDARYSPDRAIWLRHPLDPATGEIRTGLPP